MQRITTRTFLKSLLVVLGAVFLFIAPQTAQAAYPFGDELIRYTFEDASTTAVVNSGTGGSAYNSTFSGNAALVATSSLIGGYAAAFDESGDYIDTKFGSSTNPTTQPFTISMWAIASSSCATLDKHVFGVSATPAASRFYMRCGSAGPNKFVIRVQGQAAVISATTVTYGQRYNIVMVASSTKAFFYVNGVLSASSTYTSYTLPGPLYVGNIWENGSTPANQGFGGTLDEVAIYNRALTASEITDMANYVATSSSPTSPAAVGYDTKAYLTWTAPSSQSPITDYQIEYKLSASSTYATFSDGVSTATTTFVTGLTNGSSYDFRISAVTAGGTSTPSSVVTVTPTSRIEFVSPTPTQSSTISTNSITVYASTSPSSYTGTTTTTQVIRLETAGGSLVSQVSTTTRYGDYNLTHYTNQVSGRDLSLVDNSSGAAYVPTTNTFFIPHNRAAGADSTIDEVDTEGNLIKTITCTACGDNEGITLISSVASTTAGGYDHTFMVSTENNLSSSTMFRIKVNSGLTTTVNATDFFNLGVSHGSNLGMEGIAYNPEKDVFYLAREKSTPALYEVKLNGASRNLVASQICSNLDFTSIATDFSDLAYKNNVLYVLSHENDRLIPVNVSSTSTCSFVDSDGDTNTSNDTGDYLNTIPVGVTAQPEGVTFDATGEYLYVIGEADFYARYRSTTFTSQTTFTGLSNGNYVLKSSFTDVNGVVSSSSDRAFTVNVDSTAPSISAVGTTTLSTSTATIGWTTDENSSSQVTYGTTVAYGATTTLDATLVTNHSVALTGLTPNTTYHYRVYSTDAANNLAVSSDGTFTTASTDAIAPSVSLITPTNASVIATTTTVSASASDNIGVVGVKFYVDTTLIGSEDTVAPYQVSFDTTSVSNASHTIVAVARDAGGNIATSSSATITVDNAGPTLSSVTATPSNTTASISWTTNETSTSQVEYGLTSSYTASSTLDATLVTNHTVALSGLSQVTTYHYRVISVDALGNRTNGSDQTFATVDTTAPTISNLTSTSVSTSSATITWDTDELATRQVEYGLTSAYSASTSLSVASSTSHSVALTGLTPSTTYHYRVVNYDLSGNRVNSSDQTFTTQDTFSISGLTATVDSSTGATITWTTPQAGSSYIRYGLSSNVYNATTSEVDTSPRVTSHSVSLTGLLPCTTYHVKAYSKDAALTLVNSSNTSFTTSGGCTATADTATTTESVITTASGGSVSLTGTTGNVTLTIPASFTGTSSSATFQAKDLNASTFFAGVAKPTGESLVGNRVFNLTAYSNLTTKLTTFNATITVMLSYSGSDVSGITESTLSIYRYDGSTWNELPNCVVDTNAKTVTCETTAFSDFAIFGTASASVSAPRSTTVAPISGSSSSGRAVAIAITPATTQTTVPGKMIGVYQFTRVLSVGSTGADVQKLQQFLNTHGFTVAKTGVGSIGKENTNFGPGTKAAVIKFQEYYKKDILTPSGLTKGTGKFANASMAKANAIIKMESR
ncbi:MAG: hypothetical protein RL094_370 [Candidatus Parcubacteria bacterium]|jgi:uncharacterized protein YjiK